MSGTRSERAARPRVGHIRFLNCRPILWGLLRSDAERSMELVLDTPDHLNDQLVAGTLDIGAISLVEYLRHADELLLLPGLAIGSDGPVQSVELIARVPLAALDGAPVALGSTSRTSVLLAQMWLESVHGVRPTYVVRPPDLTAMLAAADAAVLIGDPALRATYEAPALGLDVHDLGEAWRSWTGLPMVFAVWAVRRDYARAHPETVAAVQALLSGSRDDALKHIDEIAEEAAESEVFDQPTLATYFRTLDYSLGERQVRSIEEFARRAAAAGALAGPVTPTFAPV